MVAIMRSEPVATPLDGLAVYPVRNEDDHQHLRQWLQMRSTVAIDTETSGVGYWDQVRLVQIGDCSTVFVLDADEAKDVLVDLLSGRYQLLLHNAPFDIPHLVRITGHDTANVMRYVNDTMTMSQLIRIMVCSQRRS